MVKAFISYGPQETEKPKGEALYECLADPVHLVWAEFLWESVPQSTAGGITQVAGVSVLAVNR